jgi:hypothetical protein
MEKTIYLPRITVKFEDLLAKREGVATALVTLCAVLAITLGVVWLFLRKEPLLFAVLGFSACYLIGRNFWKHKI